MKKILTVLMIIALVMSMSVTAVYAEGSKANNPGFSPSENPSIGEAQRARVAEFVSMLAEKRDEIKELQMQSKAQLQAQREAAKEFKFTLREMFKNFKNMTEEQRAPYLQDMEILRNQIRETHKYYLEIKSAAREQIRQFIRECVPNGVPAEGEIEETAHIIDEL